MDIEDLLVFGFVVLGFLGVTGGMYLLTFVPRLWRTVRIIGLLIVLDIDSSIAEDVCKVYFHDQAKGTIWTRVFLITLVASATYIFALIARVQHTPVMSPMEEKQKSSV